MTTTTPYTQLFLRLALGLGFLFAVADRFGLLGAPGAENIAWGNMDNFLSYTQTLMPIVSKPIADVFGWIATIAELLFGVLLIVGYKTSATAKGSFALLLVFGLSMAIFAGYKAPFNYSVFAAAFGALLLSTQGVYKWSIDGLLAAGGK
jgi:uncharacterized membrane protein YphA (DoxX/SURF4 family)